MRITITKGERADRVDGLRDDGSSISTAFPHKGPLPHDLVHFVVESELGICAGFWGMVAAGRHPEQIAGIAKAAGHASATRASVPDAAIIPIVQAERAVECFEADLWSGSEGDSQTLRRILAAGCAQSLVPALKVDDVAIARIRSVLADLHGQWTELAQGESLSFEWTERAAA